MICPNCGKEFAKVDVSNPRRGKNRQLVGIAMFLLGLVGFFGSNSGFGLLSSAGFIIVGGAVYLSGRIQHWYHAE
jgi:hypothetical protein